LPPWADATSQFAIDPGNPSVGLAIDPRNSANIYAATGGHGIFKSTDGARNWGPVNSGLAATTVYAVALESQNPGTIYAGTGIGIMKTADWGASWTAANVGMPAGYIPTSFAVDPNRPGTVYAHRCCSGLFRTIDGGASWSAMSLPDGTDFDSQAAFDPQNSGTIYAGGGFLHAPGFGGGYIFKSTDGGASWTHNSSTLGNTITAVTVDPHDPNTVYAGAFYRAFKSTDGGTTWTDMKVPLGPVSECAECLDIGIVAVDPQDSNTVYAAGAIGVAKSTDGGASWQAMNSGLPLAPSDWSGVVALVIDPQNSNNLYVAAGGKVFRSTKGAANWTDVSAGLTGPNVTSLAMDPKDPAAIYAGTAGGGIFAIAFAP
jgi:photosystem II stability/assembly factor-like uncharacterized protein